VEPAEVVDIIARDGFPLWRAGYAAEVAGARLALHQVAVLAILDAEDGRHRRDAAVDRLQRPGLALERVAGA
jgi:hypothetical protein